MLPWLTAGSCHSHGAKAFTALPWELVHFIHLLFPVSTEKSRAAMKIWAPILQTLMPELNSKHVSRQRGPFMCLKSKHVLKRLQAWSLSVEGLVP